MAEILPNSGNLITYGIDVSQNNGVINWPLVKTNSPTIDYVYMKVSEGASRFDSQVVNNANGCIANKIPFGYYHFAYMNGTDPVQDATSEGNYFLANIKRLPKAQLAPVLDIESNPGGFSPDQVQAWIKTFMDVMAKNGYDKVILYSYAPFLNDNLPANHALGYLPLWLAAYVSLALPILPRGWSNFFVWQFTSTGSVKGISGQVDINKSAPELIQALKIGGGLVALLLTAGLFFLVIRFAKNKKKKKNENG